ncbi:GNAT family N-acetyltransferase [Aquimarina sp. 2201CG1-2-11]|uniref:GNAT family N-acetyltransferase n=1 Tax=Aquimarina discodermiae TaxID=3231043 RepID=UPI003461A9E1
MKIRIETERFIIRNIEEDDVNGMFELDSDPEVHKYIGNEPVKTKEEARQVINFIREQYIDNEMGRLAIVDKITNDFIGWTGLKYEQSVRKNLSYYDLGYRIRKKYWGKGIATETARESLKYGFNTLNLKEINGAADVNNIASNKILKKGGLKFIETFDFEGVTHNWYGAKKTEWIAKNCKK